MKKKKTPARGAKRHIPRLGEPGYVNRLALTKPVYKNDPEAAQTYEKPRIGRPPIIYGERRLQIAISISESVLKQLNSRAVELGIPLSRLLDQLLPKVLALK